MRDEVAQVLPRAAVHRRHACVSRPESADLPGDAAALHIVALSNWGWRGVRPCDERQLPRQVERVLHPRVHAGHRRGGCAPRRPTNVRPDRNAFTLRSLMTKPDGQMGSERDAAGAGAIHHRLHLRERGSSARRCRRPPMMRYGAGRWERRRRCRPRARRSRIVARARRRRRRRGRNTKGSSMVSPLEREVRRRRTKDRAPSQPTSQVAVVRSVDPSAWQRAR